MQSQHEAIKIQEELDRLLKLSKHKGAMEGDARCPSAIPKNVCTGHLQADKCSFFSVSKAPLVCKELDKGKCHAWKCSKPTFGILDFGFGP